MARMEYCLPLVASETLNISHCTIFKVRRDTLSEAMSCVNITSNTVNSLANMCNNNLPLTPTSLSPINAPTLSPSESSNGHGSQQNLLRGNLPNPSNWVQTNRVNSGQPEANITTTSRLDGSTRRKKRVQGISLYFYLFRI